MVYFAANHLTNPKRQKIIWKKKNWWCRAARSSQIVKTVDILGVQIICWNDVEKNAFMHFNISCQISVHSEMNHHFHNEIKNKFETKELKFETMVVNIPNAFSLLNIMHISPIFVSSSHSELSFSVAFFLLGWQYC